MGWGHRTLANTPIQGTFRGHGRRRRPNMGLGRSVREAAGLQEAKEKGEVTVATIG